MPTGAGLRAECAVALLQERLARGEWRDAYALRDGGALVRAERARYPAGSALPALTQLTLGAIVALAYLMVQMQARPFRLTSDVFVALTCSL